jgi:hypothetical protein
MGEIMGLVRYAGYQIPPFTMCFLTANVPDESRSMMKLWSFSSIPRVTKDKLIKRHDRVLKLQDFRSV